MMFYFTLSEITVLHQFLFRKNKITAIKICEFIGGSERFEVVRHCDRLDHRSIIFTLSMVDSEGIHQRTVSQSRLIGFSQWYYF